jgi:anti-sigma regulatory factor (Ser/Thr protein kinase)
VRLELEADLAQLNRIREFVTESATSLGIAPSSFDDLRLAVDEAVTNILTHGYRGPGDIEIELDTAGADLVIRLRDRAMPFDPAHSPLNDPHNSEQGDAPGGFGVYLIRTVMDEVSHRPLDPGNELTMIKRGVVE